MPHLEFISSTSQFQSTYLTSSNLTHTENQRVIDFMVQVRDTISILNNRNQ